MLRNKPSCSVAAEENVSPSAVINVVIKSAPPRRAVSLPESIMASDVSQLGAHTRYAVEARGESTTSGIMQCHIPHEISDIDERQEVRKQFGGKLEYVHAACRSIHYPRDVKPHPSINQ